MAAMAVSLVYFGWWLDWGNGDNLWLYGLLFVGEIYHVGSSLLFWATIWPLSQKEKSKVGGKEKRLGRQPSVDVFITVAGEPAEVVVKTLRAARDLDYQNHRVFILNDGYVAKKENWREIEKLARDEGVGCITRTIAGGAKAGNINNALRLTSGEYVTILDADMVPKRHYLKKLLSMFDNQKVGFAQSPQYYKNYRTNEVTRGAWQQQQFFFGPIMAGKGKINSAFICGTNFLIKRKALLAAGGMNEKNIAEDFVTSLRVHQAGWESRYTTEVLTRGLAPEDMLSYYKQQLRWARGSLEVLFSMNPLFKRGLSWTQKWQYIFSAMYYLNGLIVLFDIFVPMFFLYTGISPVKTSSSNFAFYFIPYMVLTFLILNSISKNRLSFRAISFSYSSWWLQLQALFSVISGKKMAFAVTPKKMQSGDFSNLAYPHLIYVLLAVTGVGLAVYREGISAGVVTNMAWVGFNIIIFWPYIKAAIGWDKRKTWSIAPRSEVVARVEVKND